MSSIQQRGAAASAVPDEDAPDAEKQSMLATPAGAASSAAATAPVEPAAAAPAAAPPKPAESPSTASALPAIGFWIIMSCSVILFNKYLYNTVFPHPITLTTIHMLFATCATWSLRFLGYLEGPTFGWSVWSRTVIPIGLLYSTSLSTSNLGASRLSVSFVQMIKALTPFVSLGAGIALGVESANARQAILVAIMCAGVVVASYGEILWDTVGVFFQVTSVAAEGSRLIVTQVLLQKHLPKSNPLVSLSIFAPPCFALLLPVALTFEPDALAKLSDLPVALVILMNTLTAFVLNIAVIILVTKAGGLVMTLAGIVKDIALIVASIFIFANPVTATQVVGYTLALLGLNAYNEFKSRKTENPPLATILKTAVSNRQAMFIALGALVLFIMSAQSLVSYEKTKASANPDTTNGEADEARRLLAAPGAW